MKILSFKARIVPTPLAEYATGEESSRIAPESLGNSVITTEMTFFEIPLELFEGKTNRHSGLLGMSLVLYGYSLTAIQGHKETF